MILSIEKKINFCIHFCEYFSKKKTKTAHLAISYITLWTDLRTKIVFIYSILCLFSNANCEKWDHITYKLQKVMCMLSAVAPCGLEQVFRDCIDKMHLPFEYVPVELSVYPFFFSLQNKVYFCILFCLTSTSNPESRQAFFSHSHCVILIFFSFTFHKPLIFYVFLMD